MIALALIKEIIEDLKELEGDTSIPKNVKNKIQKTIEALQLEDVNLGKDKAIQELDEVADDVNIQPYTRTQIWNIVSRLEKI